MKRLFIPLPVVLVLFSGVLTAQAPKIAAPYVSEVWLADRGDGTYKNPVLYADYSDPDVVRVGDDFYLTASSFNCMPGLPVLHSRDLVNWQIIGHALQKQVPAAHYDVPQHGNGVWAPCIRYHLGEFYIYWGDPDFGVYMVKTRDPAGEWESPVLVLEGKGIIDPSPLWDDDGQAYLVHGWAASRAGVNSLLTIRKMNAAGTQVLDEGRHVFDGHDAHKTIEGPKLYRRNGYYYIFAPAGGVSTGWQLILRSRNIYGPYEEKVVLEQGSTPVNGPHQGAWVTTPKGASWFLHFQDREAYGRILHLQPVQWVEDWPRMGEDKDGNGIGEPVMVYKKPDVAASAPITTPAESDEFDGDALGRQWQWHANPQVTWSALLPGSGFLRLFAIRLPPGPANLWPAPNLLLQKFPAPAFTATTKVEWNVEFDAGKGKSAGLLIMGNDYAYLAIAQDEQGYLVRQVVCKKAALGSAEQVVAEQRLPANEAYLRVEIGAPEATCRFHYSVDGKRFTPIGEAFTAQPDKWIGAKVGLFCVAPDGARHGSYADFDWFRIGR